MTAYTDATITITITGGSLTGATDVHVTFKQPFATVDVDDPEVLEHIIKGINPQYQVVHKWQKLYAWVE